MSVDLAPAGVPRPRPFGPTGSAQGDVDEMLGRESARLVVDAHQFTNTAHNVCPEDVSDLRAWLLASDLSRVIRWIQSQSGYPGLFCRECGVPYCRDHWRLVTQMDEGFYDFTEGQCPRGHVQVADD